MMYSMFFYLFAQFAIESTCTGIHPGCKLFCLLECCLSRSKDPACKEVVLLVNCCPAC